MHFARIVFSILLCIPFLWIVVSMTIKLARELSNRSNIKERVKPEDDERQIARRKKR